MPFRFVHMADLHLDTPFAGRPEHRELLRRLQREAFQAAVELALQEGVHALIISGDLADGENLSYATTLMLHESFTRLLKAGIAVIYAHGNHDAAQTMTRLTLPRGVTVFSSMDPACVTVYDRNGLAVGQVVGVGFEKSYEPEFPLMRFPARGVLPTGGVAHTQLVEQAGTGTGYAPVSGRALLMLGYDYWALGHIHQHGMIDPRIAYPGVLSGRDFSETGEKGVLLVEVEARANPRVAFYPLSQAGFWDEAFPDAAQYAALPQLADALEAFAAARLPARLPQAAMLRLTIRGACGCAGELTGAMGAENAAALEGELARRLGLTEVRLRLIDLSMPLDIAEYAREKHILAEALAMLEEARTDDAALENILLEIQDVRLAGCDSLRAGALRDYARGLLDGLPQLVARRMIKEDRL